MFDGWNREIIFGTTWIAMKKRKRKKTQIVRKKEKLTIIFLWYLWILATTKNILFCSTSRLDAYATLKEICEKAQQKNYFVLKLELFFQMTEKFLPSSPKLPSGRRKACQALESTRHSGWLNSGWPWLNSRQHCSFSQRQTFILWR